MTGLLLSFANRRFLRTHGVRRRMQSTPTNAIATEADVLLATEDGALLTTEETP